MELSFAIKEIEEQSEWGTWFVSPCGLCHASSYDNIFQHSIFRTTFVAVQ